MLVVCLNELHECFFGDSIGCICFFGISEPHGTFLEGYIGKLWIATDGSEKNELCNLLTHTLVYYVGTHDEILIHEFPRVFSVGADPTNRSGRMDYHIGINLR